MHCQPEYVDCFEKASEIDSVSRLKDKLVCMSFLFLISVFKCLESGWGILMITFSGILLKLLSTYSGSTKNQFTTYTAE